VAFYCTLDNATFFRTVSKEEVSDKAAQMWKAFGQRIQSRRKELGKTQVQCAERAGLERQQWLRIEHGAPTKQTTIMSIASALDLPEEEVLGWAGVTFGSPVTIAGGSIAVSRPVELFR
jgi:DNA-binding XRE family transcriptional regulator